jgi:hypothetical protein
MPDILVPVRRWPRWTENFEERHGATSLLAAGGALRGEAVDGSWFTARLPFGREYAGPADPAPLAEAATPPADWGVLLVRKGGFAIARLAGEQWGESKVGRRHVQGRTKAGGQSQQRFARRRQKQAREAFEAAADHAARILGGCTTVVAGGDRAAVDEVLADRRLAGVRVVEPWLAVPDPKRAVLEAAVTDAQSLQVRVENADQR